jgi:hypothetical protein
VWALANYLYVKSYKARGTPRVEVTGLSANVDLLYDGSMIAATTEWWNRFLDRRPFAMKLNWFRRYDDNDRRRLAQVVNPENRALLVELGEQCSPTGSQVGTAAIALAYAFARTMIAGLDYQEGREELFEPAPEISADLFVHYGHQYEVFADDYSMVRSPGWWAAIERGGVLLEREQGWPAFAMAVPAIRWAYKDQVRRWEKGEGRRLGTYDEWTTDGPLGRIPTNLADRLFEQGGRFYETEDRAADD